MNAMRRGILGLCCFWLSGCGFHWHSQGVHFLFKTVFIKNSSNTTLNNEVLAEMSASPGIKVVTQRNEADLILILTSLFQTDQILTLDAQGSVSQYSLISRLNFRATDKNNQEVLVPSHVIITRVFNYNDVEIFAKESEKIVIQADMRHQLIIQMLEKLSTVDPHHPIELDGN